MTELHETLADVINAILEATQHDDDESLNQAIARLTAVVLGNRDTILAALAHKPPPDATLAERLAWFEGAGRAAFEANADIFIDNVTAVMDTAEHGEQ
jgi:hypothetical protein